MINYLNAEIYRLLRKKSLYIFFFATALVYLVLVTIMRLSDLSDEPEPLFLDAYNLFILLPPVVGGVLFSAIYTDDISSKNLSTLVGFGLSKVKIVVSKFILGLTFSAVIFALVPLFMFVVYSAFGFVTSAQTMLSIYELLFKYFLITVTFMAFSGMVVYGIQRSTFAIVAYIVLTIGLVGQLLTLLLSNLAENAADNLPTNIINRLYSNLTSGDASILWLCVELIIYIAFSLIISVFLFKRKEMEF
jgi:ABC-type transport system involved in multi-copper enzyme maturation permease subunit